MWTLHDAKNKFSAVVDAALAGQPQEVTRRGHPAVVILSAVAYQRLVEDAKSKRGSFVDHIMAFPDANAELERAEVQGRAVEF